MKQLSLHRLSVFLGVVGLIIGAIMLYFRPQESWYDDAFWADWGYRLSQGEFVSNVWGAGKPSYSPLYALFMAVWYRVFGFSYIAAQLPNLIFAFITYLIICLRFEGGNLFHSRWGVVCFAFGFWVADGLFGIFTCGRVDTLCLLLGVLTIDSYFRAYGTHRIIDIVFFCLWSALQMATGFEGVLFTVVVLLVHGLLSFRASLRNWILYVWYTLSSVGSFGAVLLFMAKHHCAKAFIRTTFGFSYTIQSVIHFVETGELTFENKVAIEESMTFWDRVNALTIDGLFANKEYIVLLSVVVVLSLLAFCRKEVRGFSQANLTMILSSILIPWFFILAGRYPWYYTWAAYVPCLISFCVLSEKYQLENILSPIICVSVCVWFCLSPNNQNRKRIDVYREVDKNNLQNIEAAKINPNESTYIPYEWYYYLVRKNNKLYFEGSGRYPKDLTRMILTTPLEIDTWGDLLELEHLYDIGRYKVYRVLGDRGRQFLK